VKTTSREPGKAGRPSRCVRASRSRTSFSSTVRAASQRPVPGLLRPGMNPRSGEGAPCRDRDGRTTVQMGAACSSGRASSQPLGFPSGPDRQQVEVIGREREFLWRTRAVATSPRSAADQPSGQPCHEPRAVGAESQRPYKGRVGTRFAHGSPVVRSHKAQPCRPSFPRPAKRAVGAVGPPGRWSRCGPRNTGNVGLGGPRPQTPHRFRPPGHNDRGVCSSRRPADGPLRARTRSSIKPPVWAGQDRHILPGLSPAITRMVYGRRSPMPDPLLPVGAVDGR